MNWQLALESRARSGGERTRHVMTRRQFARNAAATAAAGAIVGPGLLRSNAVKAFGSSIPFLFQAVVLLSEASTTSSDRDHRGVSIRSMPSRQRLLTSMASSGSHISMEW